VPHYIASYFNRLTKSR